MSAIASLPIALSLLAAQPAQGTASISDLTPPRLETRVLGQRSLLQGSPAAMRIIVLDHATGRPATAHVQIGLARSETQAGAQAIQSPIWEGDTDALGTVSARFRAPRAAVGPYRLAIRVKSAIGTDEINEPIQLRESAQVLLTSDKPVYQPGQLIHLRCLALDPGSRQALTGAPVTLEVEDARGNKVFKEKGRLSPFGVASADFQLADEVNMGVFRLRALVSGAETEKTVRVERYVLPKFRVATKTDHPYYIPGAMLHGTVTAHYFFGKAVQGGDARVEVNTVDIGINHLTTLEGKTDASGAYHFSFRLPDHFVGQPLEQGKGVVEVAADVKDGAGHSQHSSISVPVVAEPLLVGITPETASLVPNVDNRVYVAVATPDGAAVPNAPLEIEANLGAPAAHLTTDSLGLAVWHCMPGRKPVEVTVRAAGLGGARSTTTRTLPVQGGAESLILRVDRPMPKVGETLRIAAVSNGRPGTIFFDFVRNQQTVLTLARPLTAGTARIDLPITPDMAGTLRIAAYKILPSEDIIRDVRTVIVTPAEDLQIAVTADKQQYRPGGEASVRFHVRTRDGQPVSAALAIAAVDESVWALSELQPGLEKIYFTLERELMQPRYEIHGLSPAILLRRPIDPTGPVRDEARQRAARMLLAANPDAVSFALDTNTWTNKWQAIAVRAMPVLQASYRKIFNAAQRFVSDTKYPLTKDEGLETLVRRGYLTGHDLTDPWGTPFRANLYGRADFSYFSLISAGPDRRFETADDFHDINAYAARWFGRDQDRGRMAGLGAGGAIRMRGPRGMEQFGAAGPMAMAMDVAPAPMMLFKAARSESGAASAKAEGPAAPRVREYFPETLYWNPALVTDGSGEGRITLPIADSITTWRMSVMGNSARGLLGSTESGIKVFQDFFVDLDLPVSLTQGDSLEVPVAVYNYLPTPQEVKIELKQQPWFRLTGDAVRTITVQPGQVTGLSFPIEARDFGKHTLEIAAIGSRLSDATRRTIEVVPNGKETLLAVNGTLDRSDQKTITIPSNAIAGATSLYFKAYPGAFSQVVEGLDGILRMPSGCFEQTSSAAYPNILVLDYLKQTRKITPELQMKAEGFVNIGYQRLVTFEVPGGGFSWFGSPPAHQILTAYGLLEFNDMSKVHDVDPNLITRTQGWLAGKQKADGSWVETEQGIAEGIINRQTGALRSTAYVVWALAESGFKGPQVQKGAEYVLAHKSEATDAYTLAVILNMLVSIDRNHPAANDIANSLIALAQTTDKTAFWHADQATFTGAVDRGADLETTGLAAYALVKWGRNAAFTSKVLSYLVQSKDSFGTWSSTQGTVWSMKALLTAARGGTGGARGHVTLVMNGQPAGSFDITEENSDVMRQIKLTDLVRPGENTIALTISGQGGLPYQIASRSYLPWSDFRQGPPGEEILSLKVDYDKTQMAAADTVGVTVTIHNNTNRTAEMPLIDVGIPPGFTPDITQLEQAAAQKVIDKVTVAARQLIIYMQKLGPSQTVVLHYALHAKYPIRARTPLSKAYPYYNPEKVTISAPQDLVVLK